MPQERKLPTAPPTFQDSEHRLWTIKLTLDLIDSVFAETHVDLAPRDSDVSPVIGLLFDDRLLGSVLWLCVKAQAEARQIDRTAFFAALDGESLKNGWGAVVDAIVFFIQSKSPKLAAAIAEAVEVQMRFLEAGAAKVVETIKSRTTDDALAKKLNELGEQMKKDLEEGLGNSAMP